MGFFKKFKEAWLASMTFDRLDDDFYEELEEALILADIGAATAADTVAQLRKRVSQKLLGRADEVKDALRDILAEKLDVGDPSMDLSTQPSVVLIIGVNGVGKTTSIGKLAARYKSEGKKVLLCAGDTFRAAAADQLEIWADRAGVLSASMRAPTRAPCCSTRCRPPRPVTWTWCCATRRDGSTTSRT